MKTRTLFLNIAILLLLLATSCQPSVTWVVGAETPIPPDWFSSPRTRISDLDALLSPNGQWFVSIIEDGGRDILRVTSTDDPSRIIESSPNENLTVVSWAPDSSSILSANRNWPDPSPCAFRNLVIFSLVENATALSEEVIEPFDNEYENCLVWGWSPDGGQLAISFTYHDLHIIDIRRQVSYQQVATTPRTTTFFSAFWWTDFGLIQRVRDGSTYKLFLVDPNAPEEYSILFTGAGSHLFFLGADPNTARVLISDVSPADYGQLRFRLQVIDTTTNLVIHIENMNGQICSAKYSREPAYTAIRISEPDQACGGETYLWIYDWQRMELTKIFQIETLFDWRDDLQGFPVAIGSNEIGFTMMVVSPER
jgi:hypothetical protein